MRRGGKQGEEPTNSLSTTRLPFHCAHAPIVRNAVLVVSGIIKVPCSLRLVNGNIGQTLHGITSRKSAVWVASMKAARGMNDTSSHVPPTKCCVAA